MSRLLAALALAALLLAAATGQACTLWGAVGSRAAGGGALAAKNRDWTPDSPGRLELVKPGQGHPYLALTALGPKGWGVRAGVNRAGLCVLSAAASSLPKALRTQGKGRNRRLLSGFASVQAVLAEPELFARARPAFYLLADARQLALVEVAPDGTWKVRCLRDGVLAHTNHYLNQALGDHNRKPARSSRARLAFIQKLLTGHPAPFALADFWSYSQDQSNGPDNSLWRTGGTPTKTRTLASFLVRLPLSGPPRVEGLLANPGQQARSFGLGLNHRFWQQGAGVLFKGD
ncbi:MAG: C45 family peptidase [Desulfarculaceae bacterium]|nr:C45 family peptidase [Desulfarculaceae bacterium]MCF8074182.1 C45 family peptidase [Desulfarculaceae bacterium]MCF8102763.1 C45 family peptidase [Desulfarculaceae bacterium]MCF8116382.1 C45 family peptidase [Desulfarculaceae bacterium]